MNHLVHFAVRLMARLLSFLPFSLVTWLACRVGDMLYSVLSFRRKIAFENLDIAFQDSLTMRQKKGIARRAFQHMVISAAELFMIPKIILEARSRFQFSNYHFLEQAFVKGKGVILVISHLGSWEYLAFLSYLKKFRWSVIVKDIRNPYLNRDINALRKMTKVNPISKQQGSIKQAIRELKQNQGVVILIDQWAGPEGIWQDFFGRPTSTTSIPARLALRFGSPLVPAYCIRTSPGFYTIEIHEPVSAEGSNESQLTQRLNLLLEKQIKRYPDQWLWAHRRWKPKPADIRNPSSVP